MCNRLPPSSLAPKISIRRGKNARKNALQASDYTISIMLRSCVRARWKERASTLSVEAATVSSVAQGRRTPPARRFLSFFQDSPRPAPCPERSRPSAGKYVNEKHNSLGGFCVIDQTVALALSGGPSPVFLQAVEQVASFKKAFRRQGIGFADVVNTARFFLSRLESLFVSQKVFQIFRGRAGRDCVIYSFRFRSSP